MDALYQLSYDGVPRDIVTSKPISVKTKTRGQDIVSKLTPPFIRRGKYFVLSLRHSFRRTLGLLLWAKDLQVRILAAV